MRQIPFLAPPPLRIQWNGCLQAQRDPQLAKLFAVKLKLLLAIVVSAAVCSVSAAAATAYPTELWAPPAGAQTSADSEAGPGSFPLVTKASHYIEGYDMERLILDLDGPDWYSTGGSDCGNEGVATFNIWGKGLRKTTIKSKPGCLFRNGTRKLAGRVRVEFSVGDAGSTVYIRVHHGHTHRKVRRVLYWTMNLSSKAGWASVVPLLAPVCNEYGTCTRPSGDEYVDLPYAGSDYKQSGSVAFTLTHRPARKPRKAYPWGRGLSANTKPSSQADIRKWNRVCAKQLKSTDDYWRWLSSRYGKGGGLEDRNGWIYSWCWTERVPAEYKTTVRLGTPPLSTTF